MSRSTASSQPPPRHFALSRVTIRQWRDCHRADGNRSLLPKDPTRRRRRVGPEVIPLVKQARLEHRFGADRTQIWRCSAFTAFRSRRRRFSDCSAILDSAGYRADAGGGPSNVRLFEKEQPGDCIQVDVKFVRVSRRRHLPYTALNDCTRFRCTSGSIDTSITGTAWRSSASSAPRCRFRSGSYIATTVPSFPALLRTRHCRKPVRYRPTSRLCRPEQNGKVERSHRIDNEEFWQRHSFASFDEAAAALESWERRYNTTASRWRCVAIRRLRCWPRSFPPIDPTTAQDADEKSVCDLRDRRRDVPVRANSPL